MIPLVFEETLTDLRTRTPFEPFSIELASGSRVNVEHPEALAFSRRRAVYIGKDGKLHIFDPDGVIEIVSEGTNGT